MLDDPAARKGLIIGIIASIIGTLLFIAFINPILQAVLSLLQTLSSKAYTEFANHIYKEAASGYKPYVDVMFLGAISGISSALFLLNTTILLRRNIFSEVAVSLLKEEQQKQIFGIIRWCLSLSLLLLSIFFVFMTTVLVASSELNTSFHQRVTVLAPYLSEQEEEELAAMWASMKNRQDYEHINEQLNNYAQKNNITLPKLLPLAK